MTNDPPEDKSMLLVRIAHRNLASKDIAATMAEMIFKEYFGEKELEAQRPLRIKEKSDRWVVDGSRAYNNTLPRDQLRDGRITIEILKINCQVIKLIQYSAFAPQLD